MLAYNCGRNFSVDDISTYGRKRLSKADKLNTTFTIIIRGMNECHL